MLKAIRIKNYRIFKGQHTIHLKNNLTTISTLPGSGKTTLSSAIIWCLTGKEGHEYLRERTTSGILNLECREEMDEGTVETTEVELSVLIGSRMVPEWFPSNE